MSVDGSQIMMQKAVQKNLMQDGLDEAKKAQKAMSQTAQKRAELALFLGRSGRGVNCRIDVQILTLEDIKRAAFELDLLVKNLQKIAANTDQNDVLQVLSARHEFTKTKVQIKTFQSSIKEK
jgi:hypothetical protein